MDNSDEFHSPRLLTGDPNPYTAKQNAVLLPREKVLGWSFHQGKGTWKKISFVPPFVLSPVSSWLEHSVSVPPYQPRPASKCSRGTSLLLGEPARGSARWIDRK